MAGLFVIHKLIIGERCRYSCHTVLMSISIRNIFRKKQRPTAAIPAGERVYAIGDVHGRLDLFTALARAIEADDVERGRAYTTVIMLGDLIDRGPDSASVIDAVRNWRTFRKVRIIMGNHEEMLLRSLEDIETFKHFMLYGGYETILSYPVDPAALQMAAPVEAQAMMRAAMPEEDIAFIRQFEDYIKCGDYLFVHAGIAPDVALHEQKRQDLRWIRQPFLGHDGDLGHVVVHGHTIAEEAEIKDNRIGVDTGAYLSGRLTAIGLQGTGRWLVESVHADNSITTYTHDLVPV